MWKCPQCETVNKGEKCIICGESNPYFPKVDLKGGRRDNGRPRLRTGMDEKENIQMGKNYLDVVPNMFRPERQKISEGKAARNFEESLHTYEDFAEKEIAESPAKKSLLSRTAPIAVLEDKPFEDAEPECDEQKHRGRSKKWLLCFAAILIVGCGSCLGFFEVQRARANSAMKSGYYDSAIEIFESISFYRGSEYGIKECKYQRTLDLFENGEYEQARAGFEDVTDYKDSGKYLLLTDARLNKIEDVGILYEVIDFADTKEILLSDSYIGKFLLGKWTDSTGRRMEFIKGDDGIKPICTLPFVNGARYRLSDGIQYHGSDETGWEKSFKYEIITKDKIQVFCYKDGKTYTMDRR